MKFELTQVALDDLRSIRPYTLNRWREVQEQVYLEAVKGGR
jgi:plasmid stabilization system protein ParE